MGRVTNTESFIREANIVHENKYDYSLVKYIKSYNKVEIVCGEHGVFWQRAEIHIYGQGCPKCHNGKMGIRRGLIIDRSIPWDVLGERKCSKCGGIFDLSLFYSNKSVSDGLNSQCKNCSNMASIKWREENIDTVKRKIKERSKRKWDEYKKEHKYEIEKNRLQRELENKKKRELGKIARKLRSRIRDAVLSGTPRPHMKELLGCTIEEFKIYLESLWIKGMGWNNYNKYGWTIDHIKPCVAFDLNNEEEQRRCFHYTNLQPMWFIDNMLKGSTYNGIKYGKRH